MKIVQSALEMLGIVLLRFKLLPRIWAAALIAVNLASLFFVDTLYGQVALAAVVSGLIIMVILYSRSGFTRLLGIGHIFWIPMIYWLITEMPFNDGRAYLAEWLWCLIVVNTISLVIDAIDVTRYLLGESDPHYSWE
ncbi:MAG: hypothetical protein ABW096_09910 [Candidatus Thiodiazotropha sp.]